MILGILTAKENLPATHITRLARFGSQKDIQVVCFRPCDIHPTTHLAKGYQWNPEHEAWEESDFPIPILLYDQCFYTTNRKRIQNESIVQWLQAQENIQFLNHTLPNFIEIHTFLHSISFFQPFLMPVTSVHQISEITKILQDKKEILLEPITSTNYQGQIYMMTTNTNYHLFTKQRREMLEITFYTLEELEKFLEKKITPKSYMIRTPMHFFTKQGEPFLIRIYLRKNNRDIWQAVGKIAITNPTQFIQTPEHSTERIIPLHNFIHQNALRKSSIIQYLKRMTHQFPILMEKYFQNQHELTLDFAFNTHGKLFLLNWNSKPSPYTKEQFQKYCPDDFCEATISYAGQLLSHEQKRT